MKRKNGKLEFHYTTQCVNALGEIIRKEPKGDKTKFECMEVCEAAINFSDTLVHDECLQMSIRKWIGQAQKRHGLQG